MEIGNELDNARVGKSNALIEASYRLSVQEQRIILAAISQVRRDEVVTDEVMYSIEVRSLADLADISVNDAYKECKAAALRLKRRDIRIEQEPNSTKKKPKVLITGWVQTIAYIDAEARVELRFTKDILPYINQLSSNFSLYRLKNVAQMTSAHAIRLYEMIVRWYTTGSRCEIAVADLKKELMIEKDYKRLFDLKKRVINPAIKQINQHSDLHVSVGYRRTGRRVTHVQFEFQSKRSRAEQSRRQLTVADVRRFARPGESAEQVGDRMIADGYPAKLVRRLVREACG